MKSTGGGRVNAAYVNLESINMFESEWALKDRAHRALLTGAWEMAVYPEDLLELLEKADATHQEAALLREILQEEVLLSKWERMRNQALA